MAATDFGALTALYIAATAERDKAEAMVDVLADDLAMSRHDTAENVREWAESQVGRHE